MVHEFVIWSIGYGCVNIYMTWIRANDVPVYPPFLQLLISDFIRDPLCALMVLELYTTDHKWTHPDTDWCKLQDQHQLIPARPP